jgi:hypothetical protein
MHLQATLSNSPEQKEDLTTNTTPSSVSDQKMLGYMRRKTRNAKILKEKGLSYHPVITKHAMQLPT